MNEEQPASHPVPSHPFRWFPEFLELGHKRFRSQGRMLGLSLVVGVVSGIGAIVFYAACQVVSHYALDAVVGYRPLEPGGELSLFAETITPFRPGLLRICRPLG